MPLNHIHQHRLDATHHWSIKINWFKCVTLAKTSVKGLQRSTGDFYSSFRISMGNLSAQYSETYFPPWPSKIEKRPQLGSPPILSTMQCTEVWLNIKFLLTVLHLRPKSEISILFICVLTNTWCINVVLPGFCHSERSDRTASKNRPTPKLGIRRLLCSWSYGSPPINNIAGRKNSLSWFLLSCFLLRTAVSELVRTLHFKFD